MLSMMWQRRFSSSTSGGGTVPVHAYAFASPCVVDLRTARHAAPCVTTVVLGEQRIERTTSTTGIRVKEDQEIH